MYKVNCSQAPNYVSHLMSTVTKMQHDPAYDLGKLQTTVYLGSGLSSENKPFCILDQQPRTDFDTTFVIQPL